MQETPQQYAQRVLGYLEGKNAMEVLAAAPRELEKLVKGIARKRLDERPSPDKWSVTEILAHIADAEIVYGFRLRLTLGSSGIAIQGFDQDAWARNFAYATHDPALSLADFRAIRERMVGRFKRSGRRTDLLQQGLRRERSQLRLGKSRSERRQTVREALGCTKRASSGGRALRTRWGADSRDGAIP